MERFLYSLSSEFKWIMTLVALHISVLVWLQFACLPSSASTHFTLDGFLLFTNVLLQTQTGILNSTRTKWLVI